MKLLTIGSDRNLFKKGSDIWNRYLDYGKLFEEIHIIVFSHKKLGNKKIQIGDNVFVYPTNHIFKLFYLCNIYKIFRKIIKTVVIPAKAGIQKTRIPGQALGHSPTGEARNDKANKIVITTQDPFEAGLAGWLVKKIFEIPFQIQIHTDFLSPYFWRESFINKLRVFLAKFLISKTDGIRVVSERIKQSIVNCKLKIENSAIEVLPIFVDVEKIKFAPVKADLHKKYPQFDFIILMAARLTKEKNISLAVEAMSELLKNSASWRTKIGLIIVGSGPEEKNLQKLIVKRGLSNVFMESSVGSETLFSYYKTADLYLLTSNYEGYGMAVIEAMSAGLPVLMSDVGLAGEVLINEKNGLVFPVGDKKVAIEKIRLFLSDVPERKRLGIEGMKTVESLMTREQYLKLYKEMIEDCIETNEN